MSDRLAALRAMREHFRIAEARAIEAARDGLTDVRHPYATETNSDYRGFHRDLARRCEAWALEMSARIADELAQDKAAS